MMDYSAKDIDVLARTIWGEARGEGWLGKVAVAHVVLNRAKARGTSPAREAQRPWQFSAWNGNDPNRDKLLTVSPDNQAFRECLGAAAAVLGGVEQDPTSGSRHYHTAAVSPSWSRGKEPVITIGRHLFFNSVD